MNMKNKELPTPPNAKPIETLSLIMKRDEAMRIVKGEKIVEFRDYSDFYCDRLLDDDVYKWSEQMVKKGYDKEKVYSVVDLQREVGKIHFHNYNNTWYLDVSVSYNGNMTIDADDVGFLQSEYGCHEMDSSLKAVEDDIRKGTISETERPKAFFFVIDEILDTNLS